MPLPNNSGGSSPLRFLAPTRFVVLSGVADWFISRLQVDQQSLEQGSKSESEMVIMLEAKRMGISLTPGISQAIGQCLLE